MVIKQCSKCSMVIKNHKAIHGYHLHKNILKTLLKYNIFSKCLLGDIGFSNYSKSRGTLSRDTTRRDQGTQ